MLNEGRGFLIENVSPLSISESIVLAISTQDKTKQSRIDYVMQYYSPAVRIALFKSILPDIKDGYV